MTDKITLTPNEAAPLHQTGIAAFRELGASHELAELAVPLYQLAIAALLRALPAHLAPIAGLRRLRAHPSHSPAGKLQLARPPMAPYSNSFLRNAWWEFTTLLAHTAWRTHLQTVTPRSVLIALMLTGLFVLGFLALLAALGPDWAAYVPASCTATRCFCEAPRTGMLLLQPANTWSSFGYVLIGSLMLALPYDRDPDSALSAVSGRTLGVTAIVVGMGSGLLHATLTLWGQFFDVLGMYLVGSFLLVSAIARWRRIPDGAAVVMYALLCLSLVTVLIVAPEVRRWLFAVLLILAIVMELVFAWRWRPGAKVAFYLWGLAATAAAFGIWVLDQDGVVCAPHSLVQGHAVWHLLGAASLWLSFKYYHSERRQRSVTAN